MVHYYGTYLLNGCNTVGDMLADERQGPLSKLDHSAGGGAYGLVRLVSPCPTLARTGKISLIFLV